MSGSTISGTVTIDITVGSGGFNSPLTIASTGYVSPNTTSTNGVYLLSGSIVNYGTVKDLSGVGVSLGGGELVNNGEVLGFVGIASRNGLSINNGTIAGADAAGSSNYAGSGFSLTGGALSNYGVILGGTGSVTYASGGITKIDVGGDGGYLQSGIVRNFGIVVGGGGGGEVLTPAGAGVRIGGTTSDATLLNYRLIVGGSAVGLSGISYGRGGEGAVNYSDGSLVNEGTIIGGICPDGIGGDGIDLKGGYTSNQGTVGGGKGALIGGCGLRAEGGTFLNYASISGGAGIGQVGDAAYVTGGLVINEAGATIQGARSYFASAGTGLSVIGGSVVNYGLIIGGSGGSYGLGVALGGTLVNGGTISGGVGSSGEPNVALHYVGQLPGLLIVEPGAVFEGAVEANSDDTLALAAVSPTATGTLDMAGSFSGFSTITFDIGAAWTLTGTAAELTAGQTIFGFTSSDTILLTDFLADTDTYVADAGLELSNGRTSETLDLIGAFSTSSFIITEAPGGTQVQLCYLRGTCLLTPAGEVPVEQLAIGDTLVTRFSGYRRIKWIGRQTFDARFIRNNGDQIPVRITAGALGNGLPKRDLWVSPGHAMLLGGVLVLARTLVNGVTIIQDDPPDEVHYYQVEFETHDCVLAEGSWSETFCDYADLRNQFHNAADFHALYPNHVVPEKHLMCAARPQAGPLLEAALRPVTIQAAAAPGPLQGWIDDIAPDGIIRGWARDLAHPYLPVLLDVLTNDQRVGQILACDLRNDLIRAGIAHGRCAFVFRGPRLSSTAAPMIEICRSADRARLPMTPLCEAALAKWWPNQVKKAYPGRLGDRSRGAERC